ncbi:hypothetical protein JB92DRAFT_2735294 [Gautieria morchelliformis]|nr:hypothetical protein JB92DRAFT_2735294 [Gautieria morchelliformis]
MHSKPSQAFQTAWPVTNDMVSFLNLTTTSFRQGYLMAYCVKPPLDDGCPYGYCPNIDVAGPLVRISAYLTNFFVGRRPRDTERININFWTQILSLYSLLFTCGISIIASSLTRFHAIIVMTMASSPLTIYIYFYAVRSIWAGEHRLSSVLGKDRFFPRLLVLVAMAIWITLFFYILRPSRTPFSQESCEGAFGGVDKQVLQHFYILPVLIFIAAPTTAKCIAMLPSLLTALAWAVVLLLRRREVWRTEKPFRFQFRKLWHLIDVHFSRHVPSHYPFIRFVSVVLLPYGYWVAVVESALLLEMGANDDHFSSAYGQILAVFVTLPPMIAVAQSTPRVWKWFIQLTWVQLLTRTHRQHTYAGEVYQRADATSTDIIQIGNGWREVVLGENDKKGDSV